MSTQSTFERQVAHHTTTNHNIRLEFGEKNPVTTLNIKYSRQRAHGAPVIFFFNGNPEKTAEFREITKSFIDEINALEDEQPFMTSEVKTSWGKAVYKGIAYKTGYPNISRHRHSHHSGIEQEPCCGMDTIRADDALNIANKFLRHLVANDALDAKQVGPLLANVSREIESTESAARTNAIRIVHETHPGLTPTTT